MEDDRAFRAALREYVRAHADGTASADDMLAALSRAAGRDVASSFRSFVERPGIPVIMARAECDAHGARVYFSERRYRPRGSKAPDEEWQVDWSLKVLGYIRLAREVFPVMQAQGGGRIINIIGSAGRQPRQQSRHRG